MHPKNPSLEELERSKTRRILILKRVAGAMALAIVLSLTVSKWLG